MSTFYMLSLFNDQINDVVTPPNGGLQTKITGNYVVRVPDDTIVKDPTDVSDLLTKKYQSTLAAYGLFTDMVYDDMLDGDGVNLSQSFGVSVGVKGQNSVYPPPGAPMSRMTTTATNITWGGPGAGPAQAIITWEVFRYVDTDSATGPYGRDYLEVPTGTAPITVSISFNNGVTFLSATDKNLISIPGPARGTDIVVRFSHTGADNNRYFIGSWAVLF